jgi:protein-S-isoprenylcysteine O-methyltransferase Ste14
MTQRNGWLGERGEWYVVGQVILLVLLLIGPGSWPGAAWTPPWTWLGRLVGGVLMAIGIAISLLACIQLGKNLTPLPQPRKDGALVVAGIYRVVRHPIYSGLILAAFGWALWVNGWLTVGYALALLVFLDLKSRREEIWLEQKFPEYRAYRQRVRKLIPYLY